MGTSSKGIQGDCGQGLLQGAATDREADDDFAAQALEAARPAPEHALAQIDWGNFGSAVCYPAVERQVVRERERYKIELIDRRRDIFRAPLAEYLLIRERCSIDQRDEIVGNAVVHTG